jgi:hypothetical protein
MKKQTIIIIIMIVALVLEIQYVIYNKIDELQTQEKRDIFQRGYDQGSIDSITEIYKQTENCQIFYITIDNQTKNISDYSCLETNLKKSAP